MAGFVKQETEQKVLAYIREQHMIPAGSTGILAVSGGADSVCLLHILHRLSVELDIRLAVCHVNHGIRGEEAARDAEFVRQEAKRLELPCRIYLRDVPSLAKQEGMSTEEAGRQVRYECLREYKEEMQADWIALAHQREDQIETILFHILRGTGLRGLRGIRPVQGDLIRPLLEISRQEIEAWLGAEKLSFCTDSTNLESDYARNRIRNRILPELEMINAGAGEHLLTLAREAEELYDIQEAAVWMLRSQCSFRTKEGQWLSYGEWMAVEDKVRVTAVLVPESVLQSVDAELGELFLQEAERLTGHRKDLTRRHISMVRDLFTRETGKRADLPYGLTAVRTYDGVELRIEAEGRETAEDDAPRLRGRKVGVVIRKREYQPGEPIPDGTERVLLDAAAVQGEPVLRRPKQGDAFVVNADGGTKPLGRFFTDRKIPAEERGEYPVVADDAGILWVVGLRLSHHCRIRENTREVYEISAVYDE